MMDHRHAIEATIPEDPNESAQWCCDAIEIIAENLAHAKRADLATALEGFSLLYRLGRNRIARKFMEPTAPKADAPDADGSNGA